MILIEFKLFGVELLFILWVVDGDIINFEFEVVVLSIDLVNGFSFNGFIIDVFCKC